MFIKWLLFFPLALIVELLCLITNPIAAIWVRTEPRNDYVKRLGITKDMQRDYLIPLFYLWQTHDNACDEYWYGMYNEDSIFPYVRDMTQEKYDNSWFARYVMRVMWISRNTAYGWLYKLFSMPNRKEDAYYTCGCGIENVSRYWIWVKIYHYSGFQIKGQIPFLSFMYNDINVGWKAHKNIERCMYANRIIGIRIRK